MIMAETRGPANADDPDDPFASDLSFEERLRALEAMGAEPGSVRPAAGQRLDVLDAEVAALRERLRDQEKALVERIADVDDDRRLTSQQLQRGWQVQREELGARLRRQGRLTITAAVLVLAVLALAVWYSRPGDGAVSAGEVASLREEVRRLAGTGREDARIDERLAALAAGLGEISARLVQSGDASSAASAAELAGLAEQVERLASAQQRQQVELDAMQRVLRGLAEAAPKAREEGEDGAITDGPAAAKTPEHAEPRTAASGSAAELPSDPAGAAEPPLDAGAAKPPDEGAAVSAAVPVPAAVLAPVPTSSSTAAVAAAPPAGASRDARVKVADRPFAIQIMGSYDRAALLAALDRGGLPQRVYLYEDTRRGRPWFVLITDFFGDTTQARAALAQLPDGLRRPVPWVRELPVGAELEVLERGR